MALLTRFGAALLLASLLGSCGGAGAAGNLAQARTVALAYLRAASHNDAQGLCAELSNAAQTEIEIGGTCEQALAGGLAGFDGAREQFEMSTFKLSVEGASAHVSVNFTGLRTGIFRFPMVRQNGVWSVASALTWR